MSDKTINSVTKIPILGDIPILGFFFRNTSKKVVKTNLIIALTPYVISDQSDLRRVLEKKMRERREFVERFGAQERSNLEVAVDYRRKRGMLEEINRAAREGEGEEGELQKIREQQEQDASGPIELPPGFKPGAAAAPGAPGAPAPGGSNAAPPPAPAP